MSLMDYDMHARFKFRKIAGRGLLLVVSPLAIAATQPNQTAWTAAQADRVSAATKACTGGKYAQAPGGTGFRLREATEFAQASPRSGESVKDISDDQAADIYALARGLFPAIPEAERALDPRSFVECPPDPEIAVALLTFLTADDPAYFRGPINSFYWLGIAYRRGIGVAPEAARARSMFLMARILGQSNLTSEDWGTSHTDTLSVVLSQPANRIMLERAASAGRPGAQSLLADLIFPTNKDRARTLLRAAAAQRDLTAIRRLADLDMQGAFGKPDYGEAASLWASIAHPQSDDYNSMLRAARAFNGGDVPEVDNGMTLAQLGGERLYAELRQAEVDAIGGHVPTRALLAPDGHIIFTEVTDPPARQFAIARATLRVFAPKNLPPVTPYMIGGRAIFAWVKLPVVDWR